MILNFLPQRMCAKTLCRALMTNGDVTFDAPKQHPHSATHHSDPPATRFKQDTSNMSPILKPRLG